MAMGAALSAAAPPPARPVPDLQKCYVTAWATRRYASFGTAVPQGALARGRRCSAGRTAPCYGEHQGPSGSLIAARPNFKIDHVSCCDWTKLWYSASVVVTAWRQLLAVDDAAPLASNRAFLHDVADVGVQALTNLALDAHAAAVNATLAENRGGGGGGREALPHARERHYEAARDRAPGASCSGSGSRAPSPPPTATPTTRRSTSGTRAPS